MNGPFAEAMKAISAAIMILLIADVLGFAFYYNRENDYETQVAKYVQTAGGVTDEVINKADKLSKTNYNGFFKLTPHGTDQDLSTDHNNTPIYETLTKHTEGSLEDVTKEGCLMTLLDHPNKLFAGKPADFRDKRNIPDDIDADKIKLIKPIGYLDKNYFFSSSVTSPIHIWQYELSHMKNLHNQKEKDTYSHVSAKKRTWTYLQTVTIDADNPHVHLDDQSLKGKQKVSIVYLPLMQKSNINPWSDLKTSDDRHQYGGQIKYEIHIDIPYLIVGDKLNAFNHIRYKQVKISSAASLNRELNN